MAEKCCVCGKLAKESRDWVCEICGRIHHPQCSGYHIDGSGENPHEEEMSLCKNCDERKK